MPQEAELLKETKNIAALKKNGIISLIDRPLDDILSDIEISERPLLFGGKEKLKEIYRERYPRYIETCDFHIKEAKCLKSVTQEIIDAFHTSKVSG